MLITSEIVEEVSIIFVCISCCLDVNLHQKFSYIVLQHEFGRGLLQEVISKLEADLPAVVQDDALMAHLLDELLLFDHELRLMFPGTTHSCPLTSDTSDTSSTLTTPGHVLSNDAGGGGEVGVVSSEGSGERVSVSTYSVLPVLLQEVPFDKWRNLEKSCKLETFVVEMIRSSSHLVTGIDKLMVASTFKLGNIVFSMSSEANSFTCNFMLSLRCFRYRR